MHFRFINLVLLLSLTVSLSGCGSGSGSDSSGDGATGSFTLRVTDAPVDMADNVWIQFRGLELHAATGERITFFYCQGANTGETVVDTSPCSPPAPKSLDLLALTGGVSDTLLMNQTLVAGHYNWIRLLVDAEPGVRDSFIVTSAGESELTIPSGDETGLKLNRGFDVPVGGHADFTIDFNLRKSVHLPESGTDYLLRPTLRIVDNVVVGAIAGTVDSALITASCTGAVYVYAGSNVTPDDIDTILPDPVTTAMVKLDSTSGDYEYKAGFLEAGDYTVAFTCDAVQDDPGSDDALVFVGTATVSVSAGAVTVHDF